MDTLKLLHPHPRDERILFDEPTHTYTIDGDSDYLSVTTINHAQFTAFDADAIIIKMMASVRWPENKYYGKSIEEIKAGWEINRDEAATAGTKLHYDIECFYNGLPVDNDTAEYQQFMSFVKEHQLKPYRTEWTVWDKDIKLAGSIDIVFEHMDGTLMIYDWKRSKEIVKANRYRKFSTTHDLRHVPDTNFWHYALQLNTYKALLERNYGKTISKMCLVCLHPSQDAYAVFDVPSLTDEINIMFAARKLVTKST